MMDRYTLLIDNAMISDKKGDWVHYKDAAARISELEAQLAKRGRWILTTERMPGDGEEVIVLDVAGNIFFSWHANGIFEYKCNQKIRAWCALPEPPQ